MGLSTQEELQDVIDVAPDGSYTITSESIHARSVEAETIDHQTGEVAEPAADDEIEFAESHDLRPGGRSNSTKQAIRTPSTWPAT